MIKLSSLSVQASWRRRPGSWWRTPSASCPRWTRSSWWRTARSPRSATTNNSWLTEEPLQSSCSINSTRWDFCGLVDRKFHREWLLFTVKSMIFWTGMFNRVKLWLLFRPDTFRNPFESIQISIRIQIYPWSWEMLCFPDLCFQRLRESWILMGGIHASFPKSLQ